MTGPWSSTLPLAVLGTGWAVPGGPMTTDALISRMVDRFGFDRPRQAHALARQLGVANRHFGRALETRHETPLPGQSNPELAAAALDRALTHAGVGIGELGYLITHTATPAQALPANVATLADLIGYAGPCIELRQACTGFGNALMIASGLIAADPHRPVAIVGSETGSQFFDPDRLNGDPGQIVNMVQMGDGAGAIVLTGACAGAARLAGHWFGGIGLGRTAGISRGAVAGHFDHDFAAIRATGHRLFDAGADAAAALGCAVGDADSIIPHQVSGRIGTLIARHFALPEARMMVSADRYGNTGSAAIWLALAQLREGPLDRGARILALGAEASKHYHAGFVYEHG